MWTRSYNTIKMNGLLKNKFIDSKCDELHYLQVLPVDYNRVLATENDWNCHLLGQEWRAQVVRGMSCS